ncbi:hypothetical protein KUCAC02_000737 [Chaenocephalus aceratus]|uniref:Uncharacterized protein n=1 Tax=Chaenocephalus aceratus TaxID=36190 RepID=A0ACB9W6I4_CHAAC|nr:hypothetical protein KUCAC02_000737 [Chaenocephalus aceratus]
MRGNLPEQLGRLQLHGQALRGHQPGEQDHVYLHPERTHLPQIYSSISDERSALNTLSMKLGKLFKSKEKDRSGSVAGKEADEPELRTLASQLN